MKLRRILLIILAIFIFLGVVGGAGTYIIAARDPFLPGDRLFPAQLWSEQTWSLTFNEDPVQRTAILLSILERRLDSLEALQGTDQEFLALYYVDAALDQALKAINELPADERAGWEARLMILAERALALMDGLDVVQVDSMDTAVATLMTKFESLQEIIADSESTPAEWAGLLALKSLFFNFSSPIPNNGPGFTLLADVRSIPFLQGNVNHSFFPLRGGHDNRACETCHATGDYQGTDSRCVACHAQDEPHDGVYGRDCAVCHDINAWQNATFDHRFIGNSDCAACHNPASPSPKPSAVHAATMRAMCPW